MKLLVPFLAFVAACSAADLIVHHGKIVTVDAAFSTQSAMAVKDGRIVKVGSDADVLALKTAQTRVVDLGGKMVLPGLMDSHTHPSGASMTEFAHPIPVMESVEDVLRHVRERAAALGEGKWIVLNQVFITRLKEQRYPTRAELDAAAPKNPVLFRTGPDASINTLAMKLSGIDRDFKVTSGNGGFAEKDANGEPTGILRNCTSAVKVKSPDRAPTDEERTVRLKQLFADYNSVGLTSICDRDAGLDAIERYRRLRDAGELTVRIACSQGVGNTGEPERTRKQIEAIARHPLHTQPDDWLRIIGIKMYLDGGMLTGSAFMREPWGVSAIYSITDPSYRGVRFIPAERLLPYVRATLENGLAFTAHSVGDGAVHALLDVYEELAKAGLPVRETRSSITHSNFMSKEAVEQAARLGVMLDIQPAWLYLDGHTLKKQFGDERLRYFQPLRSIFAAGGVVGGGSDHMQRIGSLRSVNPYNPWLGIKTAITRRARGLDEPLHPEEALTREQALRFYTINNARLLHIDDRTGSLEAGKLADFIVIDRDFMACPVDEMDAIQVLRTFVGGREVFALPARAVSTEQLTFYIGSTGKPPETQGIYRLTLDLENGELSAPVKAADAKAASFLAIHPTGEFLYATAEGTPGSVVAYAIGEDGSLELLNTQSTNGAGPTHVWLDSAGKNLLVANYGGGSIACIAVNDDGSLGERTAFVQHTGSSVNPKRQTAPHAHGIYTDAEDKFVYVPDLGIDKVMIYKLDVEKGTLTPNTPPHASVTPGGGARHFALHPMGGFAYVNNEMTSQVEVFKHDTVTGALEPLQIIPTLPVDFTGGNSTAEIFVHPNGRTVYVSNRGHDSIAVFAVQEGSGKLRLVEHTPTGGKTPRNFAIDPTGKWLIASNQASDDLFVFAIDPATGKLTATGNSAKLPTPMSIAFPPRK